MCGWKPSSTLYPLYTFYKHTHSIPPAATPQGIMNTMHITCIAITLLSLATNYLLLQITPTLNRMAIACTDGQVHYTRQLPTPGNNPAACVCVAQAQDDDTEQQGKGLIIHDHFRRQQTTKHRQSPCFPPRSTKRRKVPWKRLPKYTRQSKNNACSWLDYSVSVHCLVSVHCFVYYHV